MVIAKKWMAIVLSAIMALTMMPLVSFAAEGEGETTDAANYEVTLYRLSQGDASDWDADADYVKGYDPATLAFGDKIKIPSAKNSGNEIELKVSKDGETLVYEEDYDIQWECDEDLLTVETPFWMDDGQFDLSGMDVEGTTELTAKIVDWNSDELIAEKTWTVELYDAYMLSIFSGWETLVGEDVTYEADWRSLKTYETAQMPGFKWEVKGDEDIAYTTNEDQTVTVTMPSTPQRFTLLLTVYDKDPANADAEILTKGELSINVNKTRPAIGIQAQKIVNMQPKKISGDYVSGTMYRFAMTGANFAWMTAKDDPFYTWTVKGPSKTVTLKPEQAAKKYTDFNDNGSIAGGDMPYRYITFKAPGKYTITVKNYHNGSAKASTPKSFKVVPKGTSISKLTPASKAVTVKWKKQATQTTGYQIQLATNKKFTAGKKSVTISKTGTVSKKVTKLKAKKKYYVRVRTFKTVKGTKYYSAWSAVKTVTTKK